MCRLSRVPPSTPDSETKPSAADSDCAVLHQLEVRREGAGKSPGRLRPRAEPVGGGLDEAARVGPGRQGP